MGATIAATAVAFPVILVIAVLVVTFVMTRRG